MYFNVIITLFMNLLLFSCLSNPKSKLSQWFTKMLAKISANIFNFRVLFGNLLHEYFIRGLEFCFKILLQLNQNYVKYAVFIEIFGIFLIPVPKVFIFIIVTRNFMKNNSTHLTEYSSYNYFIQHLIFLPASLAFSCFI